MTATPPVVSLEARSLVRRKMKEFHGASSTSEYRIWVNMRQRCSNPRAAHYDRYGGRGITVCPEWIASFAAFLGSVGRRPSPGHTLDRINNDGNYEPGNCRWATWLEQRANSHPRKDSILTPMLVEILRVVYASTAFTYAELAKWFGLSRNYVRHVIRGQAWETV